MHCLRRFHALLGCVLARTEAFVCATARMHAIVSDLHVHTLGSVGSANFEHSDGAGGKE